MSWNPVLNLVKQVKNDFIQTFQNTSELNFEIWLEMLNKECYNSVFETLQFNQLDEFLLIRYGIADMAEGLWENPDSVYRECRSVVINLEKEELVLTPFRKFFNLNEVEENSLANIKEKFITSNIVEVANKLDGSMQTARWYNDDVFMAGSMALSEKESWRLKQGKQLLNDNYKTMLKENSDVTFIFEYVSPNNPHIVFYTNEDEGLHLIGARDTKSGRHFSYKEIADIACLYNVRYAETEDKSLTEILKEMKEFKSADKEGWVINLDGHFVKIKCDDYVYVHRILDRASSVNVIIQSIADGNFDDLISKVPEDYKDRVMRIANLVFTYLKESRKQTYIYYNNAPKSNKKEFMIWVNDNVEKYLKPYVRNIYLGKENNFLTKGKNGYKKMKDIGYSEIEIAKILGEQELKNV